MKTHRFITGKKNIKFGVKWMGCREKVRVGVIGAGILGTSHVKFCMKHPDVEVVAIADIVKEKAQKLASEAGANAYTDYKEMLKKEPLDAVFVATPDFLHYEPVVTAAEEGKHVYVQKPFATKVEEAKGMVEAAEKAGIKLMVGFGMRWYYAFTAAHVLVREGYLGDLISATMVHNDRIDVPEEMWGPLSKSWARNSTIVDFLGSHDSDLIRWISGREAETVYARSTSKALGGVTPDSYNALVTFEGDFQVSLNLNWVAARSKPNLVDGVFLLYGTEGTVQLSWHGLGYNVISNEGIEVYFNGEVSIDRLFEIQGKLKEEGIESRVVWETEWGKQERNRNRSRGLWIPGNIPHKVKHHQGDPQAHFIHCIQKDGEPFCSAIDGLRQTEIVCAIKESAKTGRIIELKR